MVTVGAQSDPLQSGRAGSIISVWTIGFVLVATGVALLSPVAALHEAAAQELPPQTLAQQADAHPAPLDVRASGAAPSETAAAADFQVDEFSVHIPEGARLPLTVLVALHGMGSSGQAEASGLIQETDQLGWAVVAPTFGYGDWRDPNQLRREDPKNVGRIADFMDRLPDLIGHAVRRQVLLYGFSRGSQTANRFALAFPDRVAGAALASGGDYTLPFASYGQGPSATSLPFPYGTGDFLDLFGHPFDGASFSRIPFWVGVGAQDVDPAEVPHQWDPYLGTDRRQRAEEFATSLRDAGAQVELDVIPGLTHGETPGSREDAVRFLAEHNSGS